MNIEEIKIICDTISALGGEAKTTVIAWIVLKDVLPSLLLTGFFIFFVSKASSLARHYMTPPPKDSVEAARSLEIHNAKMRAIEELKERGVYPPTKSAVTAEEVGHDFDRRVHRIYMQPGQDTRSATAAVINEILSGK
jgi:hypothetical protein